MSISPVCSIPMPIRQGRPLGNPGREACRYEMLHAENVVDSIQRRGFQILLHVSTVVDSISDLVATLV